MFELNKIHINPENPYPSKSDEEFQDLISKIEKYPKFLKLRPIVYNPSTMMILGGNKRYAALIELGHKSVHEDWVKSADDLTEEEKKNFIYADNKNYGAYSMEFVDEEMAEEWGIEFREEDNSKTIEAEEDDFDTTPPTVAKTVLGDLYEIGEHRLLCGDSTSMDDVDKLLKGNKVDMIFTDPPYNVGFNGRSGNFDVIKNDELESSDFDNFIEEVSQTIHSLEVPIKYIWCNWKFYGTLQKHFNISACIVWAKNVFGLGRGYRHQHEFCFFEGKLDEGINNETDLWEVKKDSKYQHPTQKPVELSFRALSNHKDAVNVLDLFGGSGSTLMGVHQQKRKGFVMELDEKYCDVIVKRMKALDPTLTIKRNGIDISNEEWLTT